RRARLHAEREGLLVLLELLLQGVPVVLAHQEHADAPGHRRFRRDLAELLRGRFDLAKLRLELHALAPEHLELLLQVLVLRDLVLQLRGDLLHAATSCTRAARSAHRRYELTAARRALVSSASII